jgi:hypothetical protein
MSWEGGWRRSLTILTHHASTGNGLSSFGDKFRARRMRLLFYPASRLAACIGAEALLLSAHPPTMRLPHPLELITVRSENRTQVL